MLTFAAYVRLGSGKDEALCELEAGATVSVVDFRIDSLNHELLCGLPPLI